MATEQRGPERSESGQESLVPRLSARSAVEDRIRRLRDLVPEAFPGGHLQPAALLAALGAQARGPEQPGFELVWTTKQAALEELTKAGAGALYPDAEVSLNFEDSDHVFIEGDNLEVLKLLQPAYYGSVRVVYLDPPYNLGSDLIYPHDEPEGLETYLRFSGQDNSKPLRIPPNVATDRNYHSRWLRMLLPRLVLARNLLREDGAIFVSIDDHESHHLRELMDEVFGEDNFLCSFAWQKRYSPPPDTKDVGYVHEHILMYRKTDAFKAGLLPMTIEQTERYKNPDGDPRGPWKPMDYTCRYTADERPNLYYAITHPKTKKPVWPKRTRVWAYSKKETERNVQEKRLWWGVNGDANVPAFKNFLSDIRQGSMPSSFLSFEQVGSTDESTKELRELVPDVKLTPKPTRLIKHLMQIADVRGGDIVVDLFGGTGTTGQAVVSWNEENPDRRATYVLVQLPEPTDIGGFRTVSDLALARLTTFAKGRRGRDGLRVFRLGPSNFRVPVRASSGATSDQLRLEVDAARSSLLPRRNKGDVLYEVLVRAGFRLSSRTAPKKFGDKVGHVVAGESAAVFLGEAPEESDAAALEALGLRRVICLDGAFRSEAARVNLALRLREREMSLEVF